MSQRKYEKGEKNKTSSVSGYMAGPTHFENN